MLGNHVVGRPTLYMDTKQRQEFALCSHAYHENRQQQLVQ